MSVCLSRQACACTAFEVTRVSRLLFTIVSAATGWQLYEGHEGRSWHRNLGEARQSADLLASTLHDHHGIPTAVIIDLGCESVMLSSHG